MVRAVLVQDEAVSSPGLAPVLRTGDGSSTPAPHDQRIPIDAFQHDFVRKLAIRRTMGASDAESREPSGAAPTVYDKEDVNYRYSGDLAKSCGACRFFIAPGSCQIVAGLIRPVDVCDRFEPQAEGGAMARATEDWWGGDNQDLAAMGMGTCADDERDAQGRCPDDPDYDYGTAGDWVSGGDGFEAKQPTLGSGKRFDSLTRSLAQRQGEQGPKRARIVMATRRESYSPREVAGFVLRALEGAVRDPKALAAWIGRQKYGTAKFQKMAAKGKKKAAEDETPLSVILQNQRKALGVRDTNHADEVSPAGWSGTTKAMKAHPKITNPFALAYWMKSRGDKPHYPPEKKTTEYDGATQQARIVPSVARARIAEQTGIAGAGMYGMTAEDVE